jgi:hypothetical protein
VTEFILMFLIAVCVENVSFGNRIKITGNFLGGGDTVMD